MPEGGRVRNPPPLLMRERLSLREWSSLPASLSQVARVTLYKRPRGEDGTRLRLLALLGVFLFSSTGPALYRLRPYRHGRPRRALRAQKSAHRFSRRELRARTSGATRRGAA